MCIAGVQFTCDISKNKNFDTLTDSKKLSPKKREFLYELIIKNSNYHIVSVTNTNIDKKGLTLCIKDAILEIMQNINASDYLMDGNTSFGIDKLKHKIKADISVKEVSAASILAKVTRDRYMISVSKEYENYNFDKHKGYGTKAHIQCIKKYGFSSLHRLSYKIKSMDK